MKKFADSYFIKKVAKFAKIGIDPVYKTVSDSEILPICVGQRNPWHSNDWSCKGIGQWPHKALELINVTLERPSRNNCDGFMTIARSLKKSNLLINGYSKPLQWLRKTIAMASQNHCNGCIIPNNGFAKPSQ